MLWVFSLVSLDCYANAYKYTYACTWVYALAKASLIASRCRRFACMRALVFRFCLTGLLWTQPPIILYWQPLMEKVIERNGIIEVQSEEATVQIPFQERKCKERFSHCVVFLEGNLSTWRDQTTSVVKLAEQGEEKKLPGSQWTLRSCCNQVVCRYKAALGC